MTAVSVSGITLEHDTEDGSVTLPWIAIADAVIFGGGSIVGDDGNCLRTRPDPPNTGEFQYDFDDAAATFGGDFSDGETMIAIHQRAQAAQQRADADNVLDGGIETRLHSGGTAETDYNRYFHAGVDVTPVNEAYELFVIDPTVSTSSSYRAVGAGTFDDSNVSNFSITNTALTGSAALELWSRLYIITPVTLIGGDGGDTDGVFQDFFDHADTTFCRAYPAPFNEMRISKTILQIGNGGTNATVFNDTGFSFEFAEDAGTGVAIAGSEVRGYQHIQENSLGFRADMGSSDDCTITSCNFSSILKYKFIVLGSTGDTFKMNFGIIKGAGNFQVSPAGTFDGILVDDCETMVFT